MKSDSSVHHVEELIDDSRLLPADKPKLQHDKHKNTNKNKRGKNIISFIPNIKPQENHKENDQNEDESQEEEDTDEDDDDTTIEKLKHNSTQLESKFMNTKDKNDERDLCERVNNIRLSGSLAEKRDVKNEENSEDDDCYVSRGPTRNTDIKNHNRKPYEEGCTVVCDQYHIQRYQLDDIMNYIQCNSLQQLFADIEPLVSELARKQPIHDRPQRTRTSTCSSSNSCHSSPLSSPAQSPSNNDMVYNDVTCSCCMNQYHHQSSSATDEAWKQFRDKGTEEIEEILAQPPTPEEEKLKNELVQNIEKNNCQISKGVQAPAGLPPETVTTQPESIVQHNDISYQRPSTVDATELNITTTNCVSQENRTKMLKKLEPKKKTQAWVAVHGRNLAALGSGDKDGDSQLMILLCKKEVHYEYVYYIVDRLVKEEPKYLLQRNEGHEDALYLASMYHPQEPFIAGFIAECLIEIEQSVNEKYTDTGGLLHCLVMKGDECSEVLRTLCRLKANGEPAFNLNAKNKEGYTPLHLAVNEHCKDQVENYKNIEILLNSGADLLVVEHKAENTVLHTLINKSCDPKIVHMLLEYCSNEYSLANTPNMQSNTPLHLACVRNDLDIDVQKEVISTLVQYGGLNNIKNIRGAVPFNFVTNERKQEIRAVLHASKVK